MEFGLSLLPLLGGFLFLVIIRPSVPSLQRLEGYNLLLPIVCFGVIADLLSSLLIYGYAKSISENVAFITEIPFFQYFKDLELDTAAYSATHLLSVPVSLTLAFALKYVLKRFDQTQWLRNYVQDDGSQLEVFLIDAQLRDKMISITLKNRKVYVGLVVESEFSREKGNEEDYYLKILPTLSGYRDPNSLKVVFTTRYSDKWTNKDLLKRTKLKVSDFEILISGTEVMTISKFDYTVYQNFDEQRDP